MVFALWSLSVQCIGRVAVTAGCVRCWCDDNAGNEPARGPTSTGTHGAVSVPASHLMAEQQFPGG